MAVKRKIWLGFRSGRAAVWTDWTFKMKETWCEHLQVRFTIFLNLQLTAVVILCCNFLFWRSFILETKALNQQYAHTFSAPPPIHVNTAFKDKPHFLGQTHIFMRFQSKHSSGSGLRAARQRRLQPLLPLGKIQNWTRSCSRGQKDSPASAE